jgi:hypothetical protein
VNPAIFCRNALNKDGIARKELAPTIMAIKQLKLTGLR